MLAVRALMIEYTGRTYRYYQGEPLYEFGSGMSYSTFEHSCSCDDKAVEQIACSCVVNNTAAMGGDEVVMVFDALSKAIREEVGKSHPVPKKRLVDFSRVSIGPHSSARIEFVLPKSSLYLTTLDGERKVYSGQHRLVFSRGNGNDVAVLITV